MPGESFTVDVDVLVRGAKRITGSAEQIRTAADLGVLTAPAAMGPGDVVAAFDGFAAAWHTADEEYAAAAESVPATLTRTVDNYTAADIGVRDGFQELRRRLDDPGGPVTPYRGPR